VWRPGGAILGQWIVDGRVVGALPMTVAADESAAVAWLAPATPIVWPDARDEAGRLRPPAQWGHVCRRWEGPGVLTLTPPDRPHSIWHFWNDDGSFRGWYVHLQAPARRAFGRLQTTDWQLDLIVRPGGEVIWKDEDDLARALEIGLHTPDEAEAAYAEAHAVLDEWPFPTGWEAWKPDAAWPVPQLPGDWAATKTDES
jgi:hypothetical protein